MTNEKVIAVDIGGTSIKYGLATEAGALTEVGETASRASQGGSAVIDSVNKVVAGILQRNVPVKGIAISTAGIVDRDRKMVVGGSDNIENYVGISFQKTIGDALSLPVAVENDVNCALLGECWQNMPKAKSVLMLAFGTGIGGSLMLNHHLYRGPRFGAGEVGEMQIGDLNFEQQCSTAALVRRFNQRFKASQVANGKQIYERAGDPAVQSFLDGYYHEVARWIQALVTFCDIEEVIVGGGISAEPKFTNGIRDAFSAVASGSFVANTVIRPAQLQNHAGMVGAVRNFLDQNQR